MSWWATMTFVDLENTVVPFGASDADIAQQLDALRERANGRAFEVVSNRPNLSMGVAMPSVNWNARKPFTRRRLLPKLGTPESLVVIGDVPVTDGLLAWRLKCLFVQVPLPKSAPFWPRALHFIMRPFEGLFFRAVDVHEQTR